MVNPDGPAVASARVQIGVQLPEIGDNLRRWFATAAAFDVAGADALWISLASRPDVDPLAITAALAAHTDRSLLVVATPWRDDEVTVRMMATVWLISGGRLRILADGTVPQRLVEMGLAGFRPIDGDAVGATDGDQRWVAVPVPSDRASWGASLVEAAELGHRGLVVPADPRLLDILRNPDEPGERHDLQLSVG